MTVNMERPKFCPNCGSPVGPDDLICPVCGAELAPVTLTRATNMSNPADAESEELSTLTATEVGSPDLAEDDVGADISTAASNPDDPGAAAEELSEEDSPVLDSSNDGDGVTGAGDASGDASGPHATESISDGDSDSSLSDTDSGEPTEVITNGVPTQGDSVRGAVSLEDWRDYFELVNDREPTDAEIHQALSTGEATESILAAPPAQETGSPRGASLAGQGSPSSGSPMAGRYRPVGHRDQPLPHGEPIQPAQPGLGDFSAGPSAVVTGIAPAAAASAPKSTENAFTAYWKHLKTVWLHPTSIDIDIKDAYAWITYAIVVAPAVIAVAYQFSNAGVMFKALIVFGGIPLLLTLIAAALTRLLIGVRCTFMDMFKVGTQSVIPLMAVSMLGLCNVLLLNFRLRPLLRSSGLISGSRGVTWNDAGDIVSTIAGGYFADIAKEVIQSANLFLTILVVLLAAFIASILVSVMIQGIYFYRLAQATPDSRVDRLAWLTALNTVIVILMVLVSGWIMLN